MARRARRTFTPEFKAEIGKVSSVELKVEAPPEIEEEPAKEKEAKDVMVPRLPVRK